MEEQVKQMMAMLVQTNTRNKEMKDEMSGRMEKMGASNKEMDERWIQQWKKWMQEWKKDVKVKE